MFAARRSSANAQMSGMATYNRSVLALSGLQNYWPLTEASGTSFGDTKGSNTAAAASSPSRTTGPDGVASAVDFNTTTNSVLLPGTQFTIPSRHSIFYWLKLDAQTANDGMAVEWSTASFKDIIQHDIGCASAVSPFSTGTPALFTYWYNNSGATGQEEGELRADYPNGVWVFIVVNVDPTLSSTDEIQAYFNCVQMGQAISTNTHQAGSPSGNGHFSIGGRGNAGTRALPLSGAMSGVGLLNRPMTQAEMMRLHRAMTGNSGVVQLAAGNTTNPGPNKHNAFPGLAQMSNGNLLVAWRNANGDPNTGTTAVYIYACVLTWDGNGCYTAGSVQTLRTTSSGVNAADVSCITLANGTTMVVWSESTTPGTNSISTVTSYNQITTSDNGSTWSSITSMAMPGFASNGSGVAGAYGIAPTPPVQIPVGQTNAGRLLLAVYGWNDKTQSPLGNEYVQIMYSDNNGSTWSALSNLWTATTNTGYDETCLFINDQNTLIAETRTNDGAGGVDYEIFQKTSTDWGSTWSAGTRILGTGATTGWGGRPSLAQANFDAKMVLRARYSSGGVVSWSGVFTSTNRGSSWSSGTDPFLLSAALTGTPASNSSRGVDAYGAFTAIQDNLVAYVWCEQNLTASSANVFLRILNLA